MCEFLGDLDEVLTNLTERRKTFDALQVRDALRERDITCFYREVLYNTLTWVQRNGLSTRYVVRSKEVDDNIVWEFVHAPAMYEEFVGEVKLT